MLNTTLLLMLAGCGLLDGRPSVLDAPSADAPVRPAARQVTTIPLHRRIELLREVVVTPSNRPGGKAAPNIFHPAGRFRKIENYKNVDVYGTPLPIRSNLIPDKLHGTHSYGSDAPPDLVVRGPAGPLPFDRWGRDRDAWGYDRDYLYVGVRNGEPAPKVEDISISFPRATDGENALNLAASGLPAESFVFRTVTLDKVSHSGLYLPAPTTTRWAIEVPDQAVFTFRGTVLTPAIADSVVSDGAEVIVEVLAGGETAEVGRARLAVESWRSQRFDLSRWAGQAIELVIRTDPGRESTYDYVFLEDPTVYTPTPNPRRVVLAFVDTMRADHLGTYGYERPTTPKIDRWARFGAVFESARTVSPWTLPSARSVLSGRQPELWNDGPTLAEQLQDAGYHTDAIVANAFLSQPFGMERGWTRYTYEHMMPAAGVAAHARAVFAAHPDRDVAVLIHFMDPHLPYGEPWTYRYTFAGWRPDALESLTRRWLVDVDERTEGFEEIREYVTARYDQNLRYVDDNLAKVLRAAGQDATAVLFSDHGEELWDHGGFEHGHSFYDELLRVPLIVRGPGVPAARLDTPVSLIDVPATILELEGLEARGSAGRSLVPLMYGDEDAALVLGSRPQAFGRPLYGDDGWAVLSDGHKWVDRGGRQQVFDLRAQPTEQTDVSARSDLTRFPLALGDALGREVVLAWRLELDGRTPVVENVIELWHPNGIRAAWPEYDARGVFAGTEVAVHDGVLRIRQPRGAELPPTIFVVPNGDARDVLGMEVKVEGVGVHLYGEAIDRPVRLGPEAPTVLRLVDGGWEIEVDVAWVPMPEGEAISGFASEMEAQLRELGYLE